MVQVDKADDCNELSRANASSSRVLMGNFASGPCQGLSAVGESAHLNGLGVAESEYIGQSRLVPFDAAFKPCSGVNEHDDLIASDNELFRFATSFGPVCARLRQVFHDSFVAMIRSASWNLGRLSPFHLRIEGFNGGRNVVAVECGVPSPEGFDFDCQGWRASGAEAEVFILSSGRPCLQAHRTATEMAKQPPMTGMVAARISRLYSSGSTGARCQGWSSLDPASCFHPIQINLQKAQEWLCYCARRYVYS
jgi:hypothetical protein